MSLARVCCVGAYVYACMGVWPACRPNSHGQRRAAPYSAAPYLPPSTKSVLARCQRTTAEHLHRLGRCPLSHAPLRLGLRRWLLDHCRGARGRTTRPTTDTSG